MTRPPREGKYLGSPGHISLRIAAAIHDNEGTNPSGKQAMGITRAAVIRTVEDFLMESRLSERRFGEEAVGDAKVLRHLRGGAGVSLATIERIEAFMDTRRSVAIAA